jgi:hypothetical protein
VTRTSPGALFLFYLKSSNDKMWINIHCYGKTCFEIHYSYVASCSIEEKDNLLTGIFFLSPERIFQFAAFESC